MIVSRLYALSVGLVIIIITKCMPMSGGGDMMSRHLGPAAVISYAMRVEVSAPAHTFLSLWT